MRDSFVLVFLIVFMVFLAYIAEKTAKSERHLQQIQHDVTIAPYIPRPIAVKGGILIPPPPPYVVPEIQQ